MRLIDADELIETFHDMTHHPDGYLTMREIENTVEREPTICTGCSFPNCLSSFSDLRRIIVYVQEG